MSAIILIQKIPHEFTSPPKCECFLTLKYLTMIKFSFHAFTKLYIFFGLMVIVFCAYGTRRIQPFITSLAVNKFYMELNP